MTFFIPLVSSVLIIGRLAKILLLILGRDPQKISYERRDYESVDEKSLSWAMSRKNDEKKNTGTKMLLAA